MNKKFLDLLKDKTKDFGLSTKAIEDLAEQGGEGITDETTDEDLEKQADFMARIAKSMQGEVTRKMQSKQPKPNEGGKPQDKPADGADEPAWFKSYREAQDAKIAALEAKNKEYEAQESAKAFKQKISETAKAKGIPTYLTDRMTFAEDADIEKELDKLKQELVNEKLMPADAGGDRTSDTAALEADAEEWAKSLPDR